MIEAGAKRGESNKQLVFKFKNNFGASLINGKYTYGNEIAVLEFKGESDSYELTYNTPITDDVLPFLKTVDEISEVLNQIKEL